MRPARVFAVFSAHEEFDFLCPSVVVVIFVYQAFSEPFGEGLKVFVVKCDGCVGSFLVCQRCKAAGKVHLLFVHASDCPLSGSFEIALSAFAARQGQFGAWPGPEAQGS
jgi:hypothetical protein